MSNYILVSDFHLSHSKSDGTDGILEFERGNKFTTIQKHDYFITNYIQVTQARLKR